MKNLLKNLKKWWRDTRRGYSDSDMMNMFSKVCDRQITDAGAYTILTPREYAAWRVWQESMTMNQEKFDETYNRDL
jgi:hypothetical protein